MDSHHEKEDSALPEASSPSAAAAASTGSEVQHPRGRSPRREIVDPARSQAHPPDSVGHPSRDVVLRHSASTGSRVLADDDKDFDASALSRTDNASSEESIIDPPQPVRDGLQAPGAGAAAEDELRATLARHEEDRRHYQTLLIRFEEEVRQLREENRSLIRQLRKKEERKEVESTVVAQQQEDSATLQDEDEIKKADTEEVEEVQAKKHPTEVIHGGREEKVMPTRAADSSSLPELLQAGVPIVAVSGFYHFIHFYRLDTREKVFSTKTRSGGCDLIQSTLHGRLVLAVGDYWGRISFVDLKTSGRINHDETISRHDSETTKLIELPSDSFGDGLLASSSWDKTVRVWKKEEKKQMICFEGHAHYVLGLCCVPFKKWLVSGSYDETVRIWDFEFQRGVPDGILRDHKTLVGSDGVYVTKYHGEYESILSGSDKAIKMFSLDGFSCVRTYQSQSGCRSLLLHPTNDNLLLSGHDNGCVMLWDLRKEGHVAKRRVHGHSDVVPQIVHVGDNRFASCSTDKTVKLWTSDDLMTEAEESGLPDAMTTSGQNYGLCCLVPFKDNEEVAQAQEERVQFLLSAFSDNQHILCSSGRNQSRSVRCLSSSLHVWRWVDQ